MFCHKIVNLLTFIVKLAFKNLNLLKNKVQAAQSNARVFEDIQLLFVRLFKFLGQMVAFQYYLD